MQTLAKTININLKKGSTVAITNADHINYDVVETQIEILKQAKTFFRKWYGDIPVYQNGTVYAEDANRVHSHFIADKKNWRGNTKMNDHERRMLKKAVHNHPDKKHSPTQFNQIIHLQ